jgi:hypothetical protein
MTCREDIADAKTGTGRRENSHGMPSRTGHSPRPDVESVPALVGMDDDPVRLGQGKCGFSRQEGPHQMLRAAARGMGAIVAAYGLVRDACPPGHDPVHVLAAKAPLQRGPALRQSLGEIGACSNQTQASRSAGRAAALCPGCRRTGDRRVVKTSTKRHSPCRPDRGCVPSDGARRLRPSTCPRAAWAAPARTSPRAGR